MTIEDTEPGDQTYPAFSGSLRRKAAFLKGHLSIIQQFAKPRPIDIDDENDVFTELESGGFA